MMSTKPVPTTDNADRKQLQQLGEYFEAAAKQPAPVTPKPDLTEKDKAAFREMAAFLNM